MKTTRKYWEILGKLGPHCPEDYDERQGFMAAIMQIRRLERKSQRLAEYDCNGEGFVGGKFYRLDGSTPGAYIKADRPGESGEEESVFCVALNRLHLKIANIALAVDLRPEFQGDPRGYTVRLSYKGADISHAIFE